MPAVLTQRLTVPASAIDLNGHVNNLEYVRWMQEVATAHSTAQGWDVARYLAHQTTWVIRSHFIEYVRPAFAGEDLVIATWVSAMDAQTSPRRTRFVRARDGKTLVEAETLWVYCDLRTGRPCPIDDVMRAAFPCVGDDSVVAAALAAALDPQPATAAA